jgi:hypothetical protein
MFKNKYKVPIILNTKNKISVTNIKITSNKNIYKKKLNKLFKLNVFKGINYVNKKSYLIVNVQKINSIHFFTKIKEKWLKKKTSQLQNCFINFK